MKNTIIDNRYIAKAQLTRDDMTQAQWDEYRALCDAAAFEAYRIATQRCDIDNSATCLYQLLKFFDPTAAKALHFAGYRTRLMMAAIERKREKSVALKNAEKILRANKEQVDGFTTLREGMDGDDAQVRILNEQTGVKELWNVKMVDDAIEAWEKRVREQQEVVDKLYAQPKNCWYDFKPMLNKDRLHASEKCRKAIEDVIADILTERQFMTVEDLQAEAAQIKAARKARKEEEKRQAAK